MKRLRALMMGATVVLAGMLGCGPESSTAGDEGLVAGVNSASAVREQDARLIIERAKGAWEEMNAAPKVREMNDRRSRYAEAWRNAQAMYGPDDERTVILQRMLNNVKAEQEAEQEAIPHWKDCAGMMRSLNEWRVRAKGYHRMSYKALVMAIEECPPAMDALGTEGFRSLAPRDDAQGHHGITQ